MHEFTRFVSSKLGVSTFQKRSCDDSGEGAGTIAPEGAGADGETSGRRPTQRDIEGTRPSVWCLGWGRIA